MQSSPAVRILVPGLLSLFLAACGGASGEDDSGSGSGSGSGNTVTPNESPSITSGSFANMDENQTSTGYTATASDPDGDPISFSLVGGADRTAFRIGASSGDLRFRNAPDFENPGSADGDNIYVVDIGASDGNGGSDTLTVSVTVTDIDEPTGNNAPVFTSGDGASAPENQTDTNYTAAASDSDGDPITYGLNISPDASEFNINTSSGALTFKSAPDFDNPGDSNGDNDYVVDITADDGTVEVEKTVIITVTNVNEDPAFTSGSTASAPENQTDTGYFASASDPDSDTISFSIVGGADQAAFNIGPSSGELSFKSAPDFENPGSSDGDNDYVVDIGASDGNGGTDSQTVTVTVTDVIEGGGGSAGCYTDRAGSAANPSTTTLEFFSGSLRAVDPGNPGATPQTVDAAAKLTPAPAPVLDGAWQNDSSINNPAVARVVYQDGSNHLYQVSTEIGNAVPARMSGETGAVNRFEVGHDYNNPDNACIAYRLSGNGDWKMTRLGADGTTTPEDFPGVPVVAFNDNNSGAHDGWLTLASGQLRRISGNGSVGGGLGGLSGIGSVNLLDSLPDGTAFLNVDGELFAYEPATDTLTDLAVTFPNNIPVFEANAPEFAVADGSQLYYTDEYRLYRTQLPGTGVETLESFPGDAVEPADPEADRLAVTNTRVIWTYTSSSGVKIRSIVKSTGAASTIDTLPSDTNISIFNDNQTYLARSDQWFFYTALATSSQRTAVALRDDGSTEFTYADNRWKGANLNPRPGTDMGDALQQLYLLSGTANAGETLQFVPAGSPSSNTTLGTLPADTTSNDDAFQLGGGIGTARLAQVSVGSGSGLETDILFIDTASATLLLATDDNGKNETPVALF